MRLLAPSILALLLVLPAALPAADEDKRPVLGLTIEKPAEGDTKPGIIVTRIVPGGTAEKLGLQPADRIVKVGDTDVADQDAFATLTAGWRAGATVTVLVQRGGTDVLLSGPVVELPRPRELGLQAQAIAREISELKAQSGSDLRLEQLLTLLKQVEKDLPAMAGEFKRHYPKGRFNISIHIDLASDPEATETTPVAPAPAASAAPVR